MSKETQDIVQKELQQLWGGGKVPPLTAEQTTLALKMWQKIKNMQAKEQKLNSKDKSTQ